MCSNFLIYQTTTYDCCHYPSRFFMDYYFEVHVIDTKQSKLAVYMMLNLSPDSVSQWHFNKVNWAHVYLMK